MQRIQGIYVARKCGVVLSPPAVVLVYEDTISNKLRRRLMPVRNLLEEGNVKEAARKLQVRHKRQLDTLPLVLLEKMLRIIQVHKDGHDLASSLKIVKSEFEVDADEDLNALDDDILARKKALMEVTFSKKQLHPQQQNFQYDKRVDFPIAIEPSEWDGTLIEKEEILHEESVDQVDDFWD